MTIIVDSSAVLVLADRRDPRRLAVRDIVVNTSDPLVVSELVVAELDYMLTTRFGAGAARRFIEDLTSGNYLVECVVDTETSRLADLTDRYADLRPGLADLSIVVLAHRFRTNRILTFDRCHCRAMAPIAGGAFELLPADTAGPAA